MNKTKVVVMNRFYCFVSQNQIEIGSTRQNKDSISFSLPVPFRSSYIFFRIAIYYISSTFSGKIFAYGGYGYQYGAIGTVRDLFLFTPQIYMFNRTSNIDALIIDGGNVVTLPAVISDTYMASVYLFGKITIKVGDKRQRDTNRWVPLIILYSIRFVDRSFYNRFC